MNEETTTVDDSNRKARTSITIDKDVLARGKQAALAQNESFSAVVELAVSEYLANHA